MTVFTYSRVPAFNPNTSPVSVAKSATGNVYDIGDTGFTTPLNLTLVATNTVTTTLVSDANGMFPDFTLIDRTSVVFKSGTNVFILTTTTPVPGPTGAASTVPGPPGPATTDASLLAAGTVADARLPTRLSVGELSATYAPVTGSTTYAAKSVETTKLDKTEAAATYATPATVSTQVSAEVPPLVESAIAADPTVANAAADAVTTATNNAHLSYTLAHGPQAKAITLTTVRGAPAFGSPAKYGSALSGGVVKATGVLPDAPALELDGWILKSAIPVTSVDIAWSLNGFCYIGVEPTTGYLSFTTSGSNKRISTVNVCDGVWHHIAVQMTRSGTTSTLQGLWIDGVEVTGTALSVGLTWNKDLTVGGNPGSGFDFEGSIDGIRVSEAIIYAGTFTPPATQYSATATTRLLAPMESSAATHYPVEYPPRPTAAKSGAVTYVGPASAPPTDALPLDFWRKTP